MCLFSLSFSCSHFLCLCFLSLCFSLSPISNSLCLSLSLYCCASLFRICCHIGSWKHVGESDEAHFFRQVTGHTSLYNQYTSTYIPKADNDLFLFLAPCCWRLHLIIPVLPWLLVDLAEPLDDVIGWHIIFLVGSSLVCGEVCVCVCVCVCVSVCGCVWVCVWYIY